MCFLYGAEGVRENSGEWMRLTDSCNKENISRLFGFLKMANLIIVADAAIITKEPK